MVYQRYTSGISVVYQLKSAVKFGGFTSVLLMVYRWNNSGVTTRFQWYNRGNQWLNLVVLPLLSTDIKEVNNGITTVLPLFYHWNPLFYQW